MEKRNQSKRSRAEIKLLRSLKFFAATDEMSLGSGPVISPGDEGGGAFPNRRLTGFYFQGTAKAALALWALPEVTLRAALNLRMLNIRKVHQALFCSQEPLQAGVTSKQRPHMERPPKASNDSAVLCTFPLCVGF